MGKIRFKQVRGVHTHSFNRTMHSSDEDSRSVNSASHQRSLQVEGLCVLEKQHDVSLQVTQTAVAMTSNPLLQRRHSEDITSQRESNM